jgi:putative heme-binding domain-containing protein
MEWDVGLPWYRPTRILHIIPGGEYGFREGTAKWPAYYADSLPPVVNIGLGCPTGLAFGTQSNFPVKYRSAFFILDWTFGRILAVHMHAKGLSYTAQNEVPPYHLTGPNKSDDVEEFLRGKGMPVTALTFGKDGAMYFTVGGRGTQAALYRVSYQSPPAGSKEELKGRVSALENYFENNGKPIEPMIAMGTLLPALANGADLNSAGEARSALTKMLGSEDPFASFSVRTSLESLPLERWKQYALTETNPRAALNALLALARLGNKDDQETILKTLGKFPLDSLDESLKLLKLRVIEVALARQGRPNSDLVQLGIEKLGRQYPAKSFPLNHELCQLLVYLGAPDVVEKTLKLMDESQEPAEQIWFALCLREATNWTPAQREHYFTWFSKMQDYSGGNSTKKFLVRIRDLALEKVPDAERPALLALAEKASEKKPAFTMPARPFVKNWTMADLDPVLDGVKKGRDFARGKKLFGDVLCAQCHLFAGTGGLAKGGAVGPDLTAVGSRFSAHDILESIVEPSKVISEQYLSYLFTMKDGSVIGGQVTEENHYLVTLIVDPFNGTKQNIPKGNIVKKEASPVSIMPPGLLSTMSQDEVFDLIAYLQSGGNEKSPAFAK